MRPAVASGRHPRLAAPIAALGYPATGVAGPLPVVSWVTPGGQSGNTALTVKVPSGSWALVTVGVGVLAFQSATAYWSWSAGTPD
jgi:hypothetical protein